jgi:hypothetical protein
MVGDVVEYWLLQQLRIPADGTAALGARPLDPRVLDYSPVETFHKEWDGATSSERHELMRTYRDEILACKLPADQG